MVMENRYDLAGQVIGYAMRVHSTLGMGFVEVVYKRALAFDLRSAGYKVEVEKPIKVYYRDQIVGDFVADLVINGALIVELKAVEYLTIHHSVQLVNYLTATGLEMGLLLNFGAAQLEYKKRSRTKPTP